MYKVLPLTKQTVQEFRRLFTEYYTELDCDEDIPSLLDEFIMPDFEAELIRIELVKDGESFSGFVIYQIDDIDNDWNYKEGWGDIREIYVSPASRRKGLGKALVSAAESKLKELGADKAYTLPYGAGIPFFTACGYKNTATYNEELDCFIFIKPTLR